jgi:hypothetical protein
MTYLIAASAASILFTAAGWRGRQAVSATAPAPWPDPGRPSGLRFAITDPAASAGIAQGQVDRGDGEKGDIASAVSVALARLAPIIASQFVKIDVAVRPGLRVWMRGHVLADMLEELLAAALHAAPASRLLLTAVAHGGRVHVAVTDDMPIADAALRLGQIRTLAERTAMRGDALVVDVHPGEGTTMTLRLAAAIA